MECPVSLPGARTETLDEAANHLGAHDSGLRACQTKVRAEVAGELVPTPPKGLLAAEKQLHTLLATKQLADTQPMALERRPAEIST